MRHSVSIPIMALLAGLLAASLRCAQASEFCNSVCQTEARQCRRQVQNDPFSLRPLGIDGLLAGNRSVMESFQNPGVAMQQGVPNGTAAGAGTESAETVELLHDCDVARQQCLAACVSADDADESAAAPGPASGPAPRPGSVSGPYLVPRPGSAPGPRVAPGPASGQHP